MDGRGYCLYCCEEKGRPGGCSICGPAAPGREVQAHPAFLAPGTVLDGRYVVGRVLGHGGFGVAYLGVDVDLQIRVAIKEHLPKDLASRHPDGVTVSAFDGDAAEAFDAGLERFLGEGRALARLRGHPNVVGVLAFLRANGTGYLVMEYLDGTSLDALCTAWGGRIPEAEAVRLTTCILDGLRAVHDAGMLHRDVKPKNVYVTRDGAVKLLDFGAARFVASRTGRSLPPFTPGFAPPEQTDASGTQGPWTDLYAAGACLYRLVTGRTPVDARERKGGTPLSSPLEATGGAVSRAVSDVVMRAMNLDPDRRFRDVPSFLKALSEAASPAVAPPPPPPPEAGRSRRTLARLGGAAAVVLVASVAVSFAWPRGEARVPIALPPQVEARLRVDDGPETPVRGWIRATLPPGPHVVSARAAGYADAWAAFTVPLPADAPVVRLPLEPLPGPLSLASTPAGAMVSLDGVAAGPAPLELAKAAAGPHRVTFDLPGYGRLHAHVVQPPGGGARREGRLVLADTWRRDRPALEQACAAWKKDAPCEAAKDASRKDACRAWKADTACERLALGLADRERDAPRAGAILAGLCERHRWTTDCERLAGRVLDGGRRRDLARPLFDRLCARSPAYCGRLGDLLATREADVPAAKAAYTLGCERGYTTACAGLMRLLATRKEDWKVAVPLLEARCKEGGEACLLAADAYAADRNAKEARRWYGLACQRGREAYLRAPREYRSLYKPDMDAWCAKAR